MKTLNITLRNILLTFSLVSTTTAFPYDMKVDGVCYNINGNEATVTYLQYYDNTSLSTNKRYKPVGGIKKLIKRCSKSCAYR